jgi:hypothetical protein
VTLHIFFLASINHIQIADNEIITYKQRRPCCEAGSRSAGQELPAFYRTEGLLPCSQEPTTEPRKGKSLKKKLLFSMSAVEYL